jgi:hypothetical protein
MTGAHMNLEIQSKVQAEMRDAFCDGAPGILVSGLVWAVAALMCIFHGTGHGTWSLLIGGVLISPLADLLTRAMGRSASPPQGNPLTALAVSSTVWLIVCCAMAFGLSLHDPKWFFPAMMAVIGSRYLVFATLFGRAVYVALGGLLVVMGVTAAWLRFEPAYSATLGSLVEIVFAVLVYRSSKGTRAACGFP